MTRHIVWTARPDLAVCRLCDYILQQQWLETWQYYGRQLDTATLLDLTLQCWWSVRCVYYSSQQQQLDTMCGLLDLTLLWQTLLCSFFILSTWSLTAVLYRVYHTQVQPNVSHQFFTLLLFHGLGHAKPTEMCACAQVHLTSLFHSPENSVYQVYHSYIWHHCFTDHWSTFDITVSQSPCIPSLIYLVSLFHRLFAYQICCTQVHLVALLVHTVL